MTGNPHYEILAKLSRNARAAHAFLFQTRHPQITPSFHMEMIDLWHCKHPRVLTMAFRGGGKSTIAEEAIIIVSLFQRYKNALVIGANEQLACDRIVAMRHQFETNETLIELFGYQRGGIWTDHRIELKNGVILQAFGKGQSLRGTKHKDNRPDVCFVDDLEDKEDVATPEAREETSKWFFSVLVPALVPGSPVRVAATPLDPDALSMRLMRAPSWLSRSFPVEYIDSGPGVHAGHRAATWPDRFPLAWINETRRVYFEQGRQEEWDREYMLEPVTPGTQAFVSDSFKYQPSLTRTWEAVYAFYDPARTTARTSAHTGKVVWSWVNNRLVVWHASGNFWKPDEIVNDIFDMDDEYAPVEIGIEQDGLHEFLMQPIRQQIAKRGYPVPIVPYKAPRGKIDFIKGLQPFFKAGEVILAGSPEQFSTLRDQLLSFPTGRIDVPNALAYALRMRPGQPVYDSFGYSHIGDPNPNRRIPFWLAVNATPLYTTAALIQFDNGSLRVLADYVTEAPPGNGLRELIQASSMEARFTPNVVAGDAHYQGYDTIGLKAAAAKVPVEMRRGGSILKGREEIRQLLVTSPHGRPGVLVSPNATWTLRAFSGGYSRRLDKTGRLEDFATDGIYKILMEGIEAAAALLHVQSDRREDKVVYARTPDGREYISALAKR